MVGGNDKKNHFLIILRIMQGKKVLHPRALKCFPYESNRKLLFSIIVCFIFGSSLTHVIHKTQLNNICTCLTNLTSDIKPHDSVENSLNLVMRASAENCISFFNFCFQNCVENKNTPNKC